MRPKPGPPPAAASAQNLFSYYVPSRRGRQENAMPSGFNPYRQHTTPLSTSQPNLSQTLAGVEPSMPAGSNQQPWYTIRRSPWSSASPQQGSYNTEGYQQHPNYYYYHQAAATAAASTPPVSGYYNGFYYLPGSESSSSQQQQQRGGSGFWTDVCPMCGGTGSHSHEDDGCRTYWYDVDDIQVPYGYRSQSLPRKRSRSVPRSRHYSPSRRSQHNYRVREVRERSESEDSDEWEMDRDHHRSRSLSRRRSRSQPRHSPRRHSRRRRQRHHRTQLGEDADLDLDESLMLSEDIGRLTKKMLGTVRLELSRHSQDFGSSYF